MAGHVGPEWSVTIDRNGRSRWPGIRNARALAERGWQVVAVEPADNLRQLGRAHTAGHNVTWLDDRLPSLAKVRTLSQRYSLILVSAVWMHLELV